jgi:hypothetical protein
MDHASEALIRSVIHDMANALSGIRGILELSPEDRPLSSRDRDRLDAVIAESMVTLDRGRHLAMGTLPDAVLEPGVIWRRSLLERLQPLGTLFKCRFELQYEGDPTFDQWPGDLLKGYVQAFTRQTLPYVQDGALGILCAADAREWRLRWSPASNPPESLLNEMDARMRDISSRWVMRVGGSLGVHVSCEGGAALVRIPRF